MDGPLQIRWSPICQRGMSWSQLLLVESLDTRARALLSDAATAAPLLTAATVL